MLNLIDSQSGTEEIGRRDFPFMPLNQSSPAEIVAQIMGGYAVETAHPFLEPAIVGIDILDMIDTRDDTLTSGQIDRAVGNPHFFWQPPPAPFLRRSTESHLLREAA